MLAAIIILSLISLLVATEADPASSHTESTPAEPLRPPCKLGADKPGPEKPGRLAA